MPKPKYLLNVDGKEHSVSVENIEKYTMQKYAADYPGATIRMRNDEGEDYDIPLSRYEWAANQGLRPFSIDVYEEGEEQVDYTQAGVAQPDSIVGGAARQVSAEKPANVNNYKQSYEAAQQPAQPAYDWGSALPKWEPKSPAKRTEATNEEDAAIDSTFNAKPVERAEDIYHNYQERFALTEEGQQLAAERAKVEGDTIRKFWDEFATTPEYQAIAGKKYKDQSEIDAAIAQLNTLFEQQYGQALELAMKPYYEQADQAMQARYGDRIEAEFEGLNNQITTRFEDLYQKRIAPLFAKYRQDADAVSRQAILDGARSINRILPGGSGTTFPGMSGIVSEKVKQETDPAKVMNETAAMLVEMIQQDPELRNEIAGIAKLLGKDDIDAFTEEVVQYARQRMTDDYIQENTPKNSFEYLMKAGFGSSMLGMVGDLANKSLTQRQVEQAGLQGYMPSEGEEIGAMFLGMAADLPMLAASGGVGGAVGKQLIKQQAAKLIASGISREVAEGIAMRAIQQTGMRWGLRAASEAATFATLEGAGSAIQQAYANGEIDPFEVMTSMGRGAGTGAVMGVFGVGNEIFTGGAKRMLGDTAGKALGYTTSLGGRTSILAGSSVMGQYMSDPAFDINNVDWAKEFTHAALMNVGFDVLGAVKRYAARKPGMKDIDLENFKLTKDNIEQLNAAGIEGSNAMEIAKSLLQLKDAELLSQSPEIEEGVAGKEWAFVEQSLGVSKESSALGRLLTNPNIDMATKAKIGDLMPGRAFEVVPATRVSMEQDEAGNYIVTSFDPSGQTSETRHFANEAEARSYFTNAESDAKRNQVSALEGMMNFAGRMASATELFDIVVKQFGVTREQIVKVYAEGRNGAELQGRELEAYEALDGMLKGMINYENYHYSTNELKRRMNEGYGEQDGWIDSVLKKDYKNLNDRERQAYNEYIDNMIRLLEGEQTASNRLLGVEAPFDGAAPSGPVAGLPGATITESSAPAATPREMRMQQGAELFGRGDKGEIRGVGIQYELAKERLAEVGIDEATQNALANGDDVARQQIIDGLSGEQQRRAIDFVEKVDMYAGVNDAIDAKHEAAYDAALRKIETMTGPNGVVNVVELGDKADDTHQYGVVVNGLDANNQVTNSSNQVLVVPIETINYRLNFDSFDEANVVSVRLNRMNQIEKFSPEDIVDEMVPDYVRDINTLNSRVPSLNDEVTIADVDGNVGVVTVLDIVFDMSSKTSEAIVMDNATGTQDVISMDELRQMQKAAEQLPYRRAYQAEDARIQAEAAAAEKARIKAEQAAERARQEAESRKPINRLKKYPEGHEKAGKPDYESSKPEDVRDYLVEALGVEGAVKSVQTEMSGIEQQIAERQSALDDARKRLSGGLPVDEAITAREEVANAEAALSEVKGRLSFWEKMEELIGGPNQEKADAIIAASEALQRRKRAGRKPSERYNKLLDEVADSEAASTILQNLEPQLPEELAAEMIANGVRLMKNDETVGGALLKGFLSHTGYSHADTKRYPFIFAGRDKGGVSMEEFGEMLEEEAKELGIRFDGKTTQEGLTALLRVLGSIEKQGDFARYIEKRRMAEAEEIYRREQAEYERERDAAYEREYGLSYSEYEAAMDEVTRQRIAEEDLLKNSEEYQDFIATFGNENLPKPSNNDTRREAGQEPASIGNGEAEGSPDVAGGNGGDIQGAQRSGVRPGSVVAEGSNEGIRQSGRSDEAGSSVEGGVQGSVPAGSGEVIPIGVGDFGNIYDQFRGKPKEAIAFLTAKKSGEAVGALSHPEIGEIDLVWGEAGTSKSDGFGLAKLVKYHPEVLDNLQEILNDMKIVNQSENRIQLESDTHQAAVRLTWNEKKKKWLLTAFEKKNSAFDNTTDTGETSERGKRNDTATSQNTVSTDKGSDIPVTNKETAEKTFDIVDYSDKSIAVVGDTKAIKDELKKLGGRFNGRLSIDGKKVAGWIFPKGKRAEVEKLTGEAKPNSLAAAEAEVNTDPSEAQKQAGNYKMGHVKLFGFDVTIENPKGSERKGVDASGQPWSVTMNNTYGYIRGTEGVDGDHIDVFLSDHTNNWNEKVFVIDQVNSDGSFDEHKVMMGFNSLDEARENYLKNYSEGWTGLGNITEVSLEDFKKWIESSHRKTKAFAEYKLAKRVQAPESLNLNGEEYTIRELEERITGYATEVLEGFDVEIVGVKVVGSRTRGEERPDSDLDVLIEFKGDASEDAIFNELHFDEMTINGVNLDINPIKAEKSGTIEQWLARDEKRRQADLEKRQESEQELEPREYDERGRETAASQAGHSRGQADITASEADAIPEGSRLGERGTGRSEADGGTGTSVEGPRGNREKLTEYNGYKVGERILYKGQPAKIYEFEADGTPVLDTGMAPVMYEVGYWDSIEKAPAVTVESVLEVVKSRTPEAKLQKVEAATGKQGQEAIEATKQATKKQRAKKQEAIGSLFAEIDKQESSLDAQERAIDEALALMPGYEAPASVSANELPHKPSEKVLNKAAIKFAKAFASHIGGVLDTGKGKMQLANIAPEGGDITFRIWMDDAHEHGVYVSIAVSNEPGKKSEHSELILGDGYWRLTSASDPYGTKSSNNHFSLSDKAALKSGKTMSEVADNVLLALNDAIKKANRVELKPGNNDRGTISIATERVGEKPNDVGVRPDGSGHRDTPPSVELGREARETAERDGGRGTRGSSDGSTEPDTQRSSAVSGRDRQESSLEGGIIRNQRNYSFGEEHLELPKGEIGKLKGNIDAIRILKELEASGREATQAEKEALKLFVGWGGLADALNTTESNRWKAMQKYGSTTNWGDKWGKHYETLRPLMTDEEWADAQRSTLSSHYTPESVIRALWNGVEYFGFTGGSVLEPGLGVGHILGFMPKNLSDRSIISGFEIDSLPGRIAQQLYPDANIRVAGFETAYTPNSKDAVVTNVPFGKVAPVDPLLDKTLRRKIGGAYNLHNYFIVKSLLELKPGGIGAFITSSATLDSHNSKAREYMASIGADLLGAIRLPNHTFKSNAGTEVTADILFFRKRLPGEAPNGISYVGTTQIGEGTNEEYRDVPGYYGRVKESVSVPIIVNEYFAKHPEMMLGEMMTAHDAGTGGLYGGDSLTLVGDKDADLFVQINDALSKMEQPKPQVVEATGSTAKQPSRRKSASGKLTVNEGKVYVSNEDGSREEVATGTFKHNKQTRSYADAAADYIALKETLQELIEAERTQVEDPSELRAKLNQQYDDFVSKYGTLNENRNLNPVLEEDFERFLPQSLEKVTKGVDPVTGKRQTTVKKADGILTHRVSQPMIEPTTASSIEDAIGISMAYHGFMDLRYIAQLTGMSRREVAEEVVSSGNAFDDPETGKVIDKDTYLSGNVVEKLIQAREAAAIDPKFDRNVSALEAVQPEVIPFVDISYKMGTPWIPTDVYESFALEVMGLGNVRVKYLPAADEFMVQDGWPQDYGKSNEYSTTARKAMDLFKDAINLRKPTIYEKDAAGNRRKNETATQEAIAKVMDINDAFKQYIEERTDLHRQLQNIYNERYNNYRLREYSEPNFAKDEKGDIHYPNSNTAITLREHQVKGVQRSLGESTLLAHQVGTGKTFTMITTAMEMRRLGIAKKPLIVVQNATLNDFAADFLKLYPGAKILVPSEKERSASQRKRLFNMIATGDFDAIIIPQSFLAFIPDDPARKRALIQQRVDEIMQASEELAQTDKRAADRLRREADLILKSIEEEGSVSPKGKKANVKKEAEKQEKALSRETRKLERRTDDVLTFEQMGIDALFIDEAHNYKKIGFSTKMQNVKGVDSGYSERANSLLLKASYVQERNGGRNVILATGTPITNTMAEVWTMMRFVAPDILESYHIKTFDEFAATFGAVEPSLEFTSTGSFKIADRFKSYVNVPELIKAFRSHADVVLTSDVREFAQSNSIPKMKDGQMTNHVIAKSDELQGVMNILIDALKEDEKRSGTDKTPGLPLVVFSKAKQAAIDLRLLNPLFPDDPNSKTNLVVSEAFRIYKESTPVKGVQMIFCDSYQSPGSKPSIDLFEYDESVPRFNLYQDIKQKLIDRGVPKEQIVIVSDLNNAERKKAVFEKARNGEVRILIGSTEKMGVGVNVQDRMIALHHMDAPIRPMDFEQRNGRILRQGNMYAQLDKPVEVVTYGVEGTLDATAYDRLRIKQNFINQMMKGDISGRVMEETDDGDPSGKTFNQMAAELSGDKTAQLLFVAEANMKKLAGLERSHRLKIDNARMSIDYEKEMLRVRREDLKVLESKLETVNAQLPDGVKKITANGVTFDDKLQKGLTEVVESYEEQYALNRGVAPLRVQLNGGAGEVVYYHNEGKLAYNLHVGGQDIGSRELNVPGGAWMSLNNTLAALPTHIEKKRQAIAEGENKISGYQSLLDKPFPKMDELNAARQEVKELRAEMEAKAKAESMGEGEIKMALRGRGDIMDRHNLIERLKNYGKKALSLPMSERVAGDSIENLDALDTELEGMKQVAVNDPEMIVAETTTDLLRALPDMAPDKFAKVVVQARRPDVQAMYIPWAHKVVLLANKGTVKELRDAGWHESFHFGMDMIMPSGIEKHFIVERAAAAAAKLDPRLAEWVRDNYDKAVHAEELVVHLMESVASWMADKGKIEKIRAGLDWGDKYLNDVSDRIINFLTTNGNDGKYEGNRRDAERYAQANSEENSGWNNEEEFSTIQGRTRDEIAGTADGGAMLKLRGKPRRKNGESLISYNKRLKQWQAEKEAAMRDRSIEESGDLVDPIGKELGDLSEELMAHPQPKWNPGESKEDYLRRFNEWSEWIDTRGNEIADRLNELRQQAEAEKASARSMEMETADLRLSPAEEIDRPRDDEGVLTDDEMREVRTIFHEKLGDMKISRSKEQLKADIKQEIIERRRYIDSSNLEDAFFIDEVTKKAGKKANEVLAAIPDYIEGTYEGEVTPELVDTAKMVSDWFEEVYNLMAREGVLYDAPKIQNYVTHIWDWKRSPLDAQEKYTNFVNTMRMRSPYTRHRVIPSYAEGKKMGMVPKYPDIRGIITEYGHYATETIANHRIVEFLKNFKYFVPAGDGEMPHSMDLIVPESVKDADYSRMNHTALDGYKVLNRVKPMIAPVFGDQRIIDPSHLNVLTNKLIDGIWLTSGAMKKIALSFSFFHHGALTETAVSMLKPWTAGKVIAKNLIWDVISKGNIPAMNDKESARDAVKHLVRLGASNDYAVADVANLTTQLYRWTKDNNVYVAREAAFVLDFLNKGQDKILWDVIHDGFKIASFSKLAKEIREKARISGWDERTTERALDEAGQLVNDTFGGLHFDILGYSPKSVRIMRALLLSPDWTLATIRQALSPFGFGTLYKSDTYWKSLSGQERKAARAMADAPAAMRKKYGRQFWLTAGIFFYGLMNGLNAYFRIKDEDEARQEADEMRKTDPDYKSAYELAYPDGMKWYDYTMAGNSLGHQTHLFTGHYEDGTETYIRWGKQFRELPELFFGRDGFSFPGPMIDKMSGKSNPLLSTTFEFISGHSLSGWEVESMKDKKGWERDVARLYLLASKFVPYSVPTQEDKEFMLMDLMMPSSKGMTPSKAIDYFEKAIKSGDSDYVGQVYQACVKNGLEAEKYFSVAKSRIEAEVKENMLEGVDTVEDALKAYDATDDARERARYLKYIEQQMGAQDFAQIERDELIEQAQEVITGTRPTKVENQRYVEFSNSDDVLQDYRLKKTISGLKKYYTDYTELASSDVEAAKRMLREKRMYIDGYQLATKYRTAITKLKKRMGHGEDPEIMKEIRRIRQECFDSLGALAEGVPEKLEK